MSFEDVVEVVDEVVQAEIEAERWADLSTGRIQARVLPSKQAISFQRYYVEGEVAVCKGRRR